MSEHAITLQWSRTTEAFDSAAYNRRHEITFKNGQAVSFSATAAYRGDPDCVDPEEAFVASLASCHMLTFLAIASKGGYVVDSYRDEAVGHLEKDEAGNLAITRVELKPRMAFSGRAPETAELQQMHEKAHSHCFIAHSVRTDVSVQPELA